MREKASSFDYGTGINMKYFHVCLVQPLDDKDYRMSFLLHTLTLSHIYSLVESTC